MKLKVLRPGYRLGNRVLRPTRVEVNMAGVEIIIRMRHRLLELQTELVRWRQLRIERKLDERA